jgi:DsbC/DsbD-like thiol-disulfide interchange protein
MQRTSFPSLVARLFLLLLTPAVALAVAPPSSGTQHGDHIQVELISEVRSVRPGEPFWLALRLLPDPGWHTYWRNPGDSGLETRIRWALPEGVNAGEIVWPTPQYLPVAHIVNYGMEDETFLLTRIDPPADLPTDMPLRVVADVAWLVCEVECIPGFATLDLELPLASEAEAAEEHGASFARARRQLPSPAPATWRAGFDAAHGRLRMALDTGTDPLPPDAVLRFFPEAPDLVDHSARQGVFITTSGPVFRQNLSALFRETPERIDGVLVVEIDGTLQGFLVDALPGRPSPVPESLAPLTPHAPGTLDSDEAHPWETFSDVRLDELRQSGRPVFVNMTADWCVTCLANERRALGTTAVREAFRAHDVAYLKGDWTDQDPLITDYLARYGSRGVPLYVLYPSDPALPPRQLPHVLTPTLVVDAVTSAAAR